MYLLPTDSSMQLLELTRLDILGLRNKRMTYCPLPPPKVRKDSAVTNFPLDMSLIFEGFGPECPSLMIFQILLGDVLANH